MQTILRLDGMRTVHCVRAVTTALGGVDGIAAVQVRLGEAELDHLLPLDRGALERAIAIAGYSLREVIVYRALPVHTGEEARDPRDRSRPRSTG
jgi:copper chaperone CopZ